MENGYIYTRVSTLIQVDGFSLDAQEEEIRAFAKMHGINIIGKYSDEGKSGKNAEHRPAFNQMMEDIRSKKDNIKYILVFKLSRFARNTSDTAKYLQELASYGIGLLGVKDGIDTSTATGKMIANIMGAVAEVELENIHEQTLAGRQQKARSGLWNGAQAPFGYALENKFLVVCSEEAEIVKEIFHLYVEEGQTIRYITKKLNDEGVKREQRGNTRFSVFTERTVRSILKNPVYAGKIAYGRRHTVKVEGTNNETKVVKQDDESKIILVEGVHEAIVTPEIFAKAETRLGENVRHRKTRSDSTTVYPLTGLIRCPDCGKNIFGYTAPPRPRKNGKEGFYPRYISYRCISGRDRNGISCSLANKYYSGTKLEKEVRDVVASMVSIPEFIELVSKKVDCATDLTILKKKRESIKAEYAKYYNNLMVNEKRLAELDTSDKHYDRRVDSLNRVMDDLYEKIDDSQSRLDELDNEIAMAEKSTLTKQSIFEMLEGFSKYYDVMTPEDRKALLQAMISYIELYGEKRADGHFVKAIHFTFPVTYDGESGALFVRTNEQQVDTGFVVLQFRSLRHCLIQQLQVVNVQRAVPVHVGDRQLHGGQRNLPGQMAVDLVNVQNVHRAVAVHIALDGRDLFRSGGMAGGAGECQRPGFVSCGGDADHTVIPDMTLGGNNFLRYQHSIAHGAMLAPGQTGLGTGSGLGGVHDLGVTGGGNFFLRYQHGIAHRAMLALGQTGLGTGRSLSGVHDLSVTRGEDHCTL